MFFLFLWLYIHEIPLKSIHSCFELSCLQTDEAGRTDVTKEVRIPWPPPLLQIISGQLWIG